MKAFGYRRSGHDLDDPLDEQVHEKLIDLSEVSFAAKSPEELRTVARFLLHTADLLEKHGGDFGHEHLRDWLPGWRSNAWVDVIAAGVPREDENGEPPA